MLLDQNRQAVAIHRFDQIIGRAQIKTHGFVVHNGDHNHGNLRQFRIRLQLASERPSHRIPA